MTAPKTVQYFGYYLYIVAATLVFAPNFMLNTLQVPETTEAWIRVVGILVACLAVYYHRMGAAGSEEFAVTSTYVRIFVLVAFAALWAAGIGPWQLIIFGVVDTLAAVWTMSCLKKGSV
jgi:hypothetical protein